MLFRSLGCKGMTTTISKQGTFLSLTCTSYRHDGGLRSQSLQMSLRWFAWHTLLVYCEDWNNSVLTEKPSHLQPKTARMIPCAKNRTGGSGITLALAELKFDDSKAAHSPRNQLIKVSRSPFPLRPPMKTEHALLDVRRVSLQLTSLKFGY